MQNNTRVECAGSRAHAQPIQRGEPQSAINALPIFQGAQTGAASEMSHDDAAAGDLRGDFRQNRSDVLVRQPVEAVPLNSLFADIGGERKQNSKPRVAALETSKDAGQSLNRW